ncbi:hypothetical protein DENSPDRAFT_880032 [Dentipellis sp. KUC8613]|nr:hypothetical protein DENSPDRAFT_880032 [Dentipellis sp. KUC8613]
MTYPTEFYEPSNGIRPGMTAPASLAWRYPDPDAPLPVFLAVHPYPIPAQPNPRDRHWALCWEQGYALRPRAALALAEEDEDEDEEDVDGDGVDGEGEGLVGREREREPLRVPVARVLEVRREDGREHCTFWGPVTRCMPLACALPRPAHPALSLPASTNAHHHPNAGARFVPVARLTLAQRRMLEKLAGAVRIMKPNGWWNGQNWVVEVLKAAAEQDLITPEQRDTAILAAAEP